MIRASAYRCLSDDAARRTFHDRWLEDARYEGRRFISKKPALSFSLSAGKPARGRLYAHGHLEWPCEWDGRAPAELRFDIDAADVVDSQRWQPGLIL